MNKDEVLEKVRKVGVDEREAKIGREAPYYGVVSVVLLGLIITFWKMYKGISCSDITAILSIQLVAINFYKYKRMPEKKMYLLYGIIALISTLTATTLFFLGV